MMIKRVEAATVVCLRRRDECWEVLMGQSHVVDWLKSKGPTVRFGTFREISAFERTSRRQIQSGLKLRRYGGEFKFFGGSMDEEALT